MNIHKFLLVLGSLTPFCALTACMSPIGMENSQKSQPNVTSVRALSDGTLLISGKELQSVKAAKITLGKTTSTLSLLSVSSSQIKANSKAAFSFVMGKTYDLIISSANADDQSFPISIEIPAGTLNPSALSSAGASPGMILKWNGSAWAPSAISTIIGPQGAQGLPGPQGLQGAAGPTGLPGVGLAPVTWLINGDGATVGPLISIVQRNGTDGDTYMVWDQVDGGYVNYAKMGYPGQYTRFYTIARDGAGDPMSGALLYGTTDCSDAPHVDPLVPQGKILRIVDDLYKVESTTDPFVPVAFRGDNNTWNFNTNSTSYTACIAVTSSNYYSYFAQPSAMPAFSRATRLTQPGVPLKLTPPLRIERR